MTTYFIGDVHGCLDQLEEILAQIDLQSNKLVFLGDYVDRGPNSSGVISHLLKLQHSMGERVAFLTGNHDQEMSNVLLGAPIDRFLMMGGAPTVRSYTAEFTADIAESFRAAVPTEHRDFLSQLGTSLLLDKDGVFASHQRQPGIDDLFEVFGHTPTKDGSPNISSDHASIDSGCGTTKGGTLSAFAWPEKIILRSSPWN